MPPSEAEIAIATNTERERCAGIVRLARFGEIDSDLRSIIHRIESGQSLARIAAEIDERR